MNFNASRNVGGGGGIRKAKRVSDVNALGAPSPSPAFNASPAYNPLGFSSPPQPQPQPHYQEGVPLDAGFGFSSPIPPNDFGSYGGVAGVGVPAGAGAGAGAGQLGAMMQAPVVQDMALQYGQQLASQGRQLVHRELEKYVPVTKLRYYFAVDTRYVIKKLILIFFPFTHREWSIKYDQDSPVQPRYDLNAPDLYIPSMSYVTYVLLAGFMMGVQHRFSPEQIGAQASRALAYIIFEIAVYVVTLYVTNTTTSLKTLDLLAFSSYKYAVMIGGMMAGLLLGKTGYYVMLLYTSFTLSYFLVKTLRVQVLAGSQVKEPPSYGMGGAAYGAGGGGGAGGGAGGTKRRVYFLLFVAVTQPLLSWWLTYDLVPAALNLADLPLP